MQQELKRDDGGFDEGGGSRDDEKARIWDIYRRRDPIGLDVL